MYIETSSPRIQGDIARLVSLQKQGSTDGRRCILEFWYHIYGEDNPTLNVYSRSAGVDKTETLLWSLSGNQLNTWHQASISFIWSQPLSFQVLFFHVITNNIVMSFV